MRFIMGFAIVGVMFFARRWTPRQVKRIIGTLKAGETLLDVPTDFSKMSCHREKEEKYLSSFLESPPVGPVCIVGPDGCGKSYIVKKILSSRKMCILADMRQNAVMTGDELLVSFLKRLGYLLPSSDPISSLFMKPEKKQKINVQEIVQGLDTIYQSLLKVKEENLEVPLIVITNIEALPTSDNFTRFIDWCISVTDNKLANIVFLTSSQFVHFHLDSNYSFKKRRFLYNIPFPPEDEVYRYLTQIFTPADGADGPAAAVPVADGSRLPAVTTHLTDDEIKNILSIFGGQMRDIDAFVGLIRKGESYGYVLQLFLAETSQKIGSLIDSMYQKANSIDSDSEKKAILERYIRLWNMLEILCKRGSGVRASDLIEEVFHEQPEELDEYFKTNLIYYWMRQREIMPEIELASVERTYDVFVTFSSPRIQHAVARVMADHRFVLQRLAIDKFFKKTDLKDDKKEIEEERTNLLAEYEKIYARLENLIENSEPWIKYMGREKFDERRVYFLQKEDECLHRIGTLNTQLQAIEEQLDKL
eukprot:gene12468-14627_t